MNQTSHTVQGSKFAMSPEFPDLSGPLLGLNPQTALLDIMFPGFSVLSNTLLRYTKIDLSIYVPLFLFVGLVAFASQYINQWAWEFVEAHFMSSADIRVDDEIYNMLMAFIADQQFAKRSRRFVANTNLNSRMWWLFRNWDDEDDGQSDVGVDFDEEGNPIASAGKEKQKKISFTPSFGTHYFWYKGKLLLFKRCKDIQQNGWGSASEREEISIQCFGRNPAILKDVLDKCREDFLSHDENRTIIYRGGLRSGTSEPTWTRCVSRVSRPFSTVVLDETVKQNLLEDMRDYLHPQTRRYYSNRGIPYRRGYLLWGPPGTGKR
jgi:chaperone BCS1